MYGQSAAVRPTGASARSAVSATSRRSSARKAVRPSCPGATAAPSSTTSPPSPADAGSSRWTAGADPACTGGSALVRARLPTERCSRSTAPTETGARRAVPGGSTFCSSGRSSGVGTGALDGRPARPPWWSCPVLTHPTVPPPPDDVSSRHRAQPVRERSTARRGSGTWRGRGSPPGCVDSRREALGPLTQLVTHRRSHLLLVEPPEVRAGQLAVDRDDGAGVPRAVQRLRRARVQEAGDVAAGDQLDRAHAHRGLRLLP